MFSSFNNFNSLLTDSQPDDIFSNFKSINDDDGNYNSFSMNFCDILKRYDYKLLKKIFKLNYLKKNSSILSHCYRIYSFENFSGVTLNTIEKKLQENDDLLLNTFKEKGVIKILNSYIYDNNYDFVIKTLEKNCKTNLNLIKNKDEELIFTNEFINENIFKILNVLNNDVQIQFIKILNDDLIEKVFLNNDKKLNKQIIENLPDDRLNFIISNFFNIFQDSYENIENVLKRSISFQNFIIITKYIYINNENMNIYFKNNNYINLFDITEIKQQIDDNIFNKLLFFYSSYNELSLDEIKEYKNYINWKIICKSNIFDNINNYLQYKDYINFALFSLVKNPNDLYQYQNFKIE